MKNFRLIAIRPRSGCHKSLLKNLSGDQIYPFYSGVRFYNREHVEIDKVEGEVAYSVSTTEVPENLYEVKSDGKFDSNKIRFNLSAIAGKNGSGKSSLIDLFFAAIFVMSDKREILMPNAKSTIHRINWLNSEIKEVKKLLENNKKLKQKYSKSFDAKIKKNKAPAGSYQETEKSINNRLETEKRLTKRLDELTAELASEKKKIAEFKRLAAQTKVDVFYELNDSTFLLSVNSEHKEGVLITWVPQKQEYERKPTMFPFEVLMDAEVLGKNFFYTIAVNYSHYSLNSRYLGDWINLLFHKNDSYQTPVVISPMRNEGNFDINDEMSFARTRLLINVLLQQARSTENQEVPLAENQHVTEVVFRLDKEKIENIPDLVFFKNGKFAGKNRREYELIRHYFKIALPDLADFDFPEFPLQNILLNYIIRKIDKITNNYVNFRPPFVWVEDEPLTDYNDRQLKKLFNDKSHISFKLHQATNFFRHCVKAGATSIFNSKPDSLKGEKRVEYPFSLIDLYKWTGRQKNEQLIRHLPPSIFEVDFNLSNSRGVSYSFSGLSSGEQQFIHTIQSVIYHLNNLQSAHFDDDRIKYQAINIILDEIELYFHPDFQRQFISRLLKEISQIYLDKNDRIRTINLLFLTHSPFILSDIPSEHVLRLEFKKGRGKTFPVKFKDEERPETFAANMQRLLANSFFITGTSMGQFAEEKINDLIDRVNRGELLDEADRQLINLIGDKFLKVNVQRFSQQQRSNDKS